MPATETFTIECVTDDCPHLEHRRRTQHKFHSEYDARQQAKYMTCMCGGELTIATHREEAM